MRTVRHPLPRQRYCCRSCAGCTAPASESGGMSEYAERFAENDIDRDSPDDCRSAMNIPPYYKADASCGRLPTPRVSRTVVEWQIWLFSLGPSSFLHRSDKADAFARQRADQPLLVAVVADRGAYRIDAGRKRRFKLRSPHADLDIGISTLSWIKRGLAGLNRIDQVIPPTLSPRATERENSRSCRARCVNLQRLTQSG